MKKNKTLTWIFGTTCVLALLVAFFGPSEAKQAGGGVSQSGTNSQQIIATGSNSPAANVGGSNNSVIQNSPNSPITQTTVSASASKSVAAVATGSGANAQSTGTNNGIMIQGNSDLVVSPSVGPNSVVSINQSGGITAHTVNMDKTIRDFQTEALLIFESPALTNVIDGTVSTQMIEEQKPDLVDWRKKRRNPNKFQSSKVQNG